VSPFVVTTSSDVPISADESGTLAMIWSLDAIVTCALKPPNRTSGCDVPASSRPLYSMTTSPPGRAALGITFLMEISPIFLSKYVSNKRQDRQRIQSRPDIVGDYAKSAFKSLQTSNWKGFHDIEQAKESEPQDNVKRRKLISAGGGSKRDHLPHDFIDYNPLSIMTPQILNA